MMDQLRRLSKFPVLQPVVALIGGQQQEARPGQRTQPLHAFQRCRRKEYMRILKLFLIERDHLAVRVGLLFIAFCPAVVILGNQIPQHLGGPHRV
ncbi:hypothetical protein D3C78_1790460 [compost metagenome]